MRRILTTTNESTSEDVGDRRDSNSQPSPWEGDALPLRHYRRCHVYLATWLNFSVVLIRGRTNDGKNVNADPQREGHRGTYTMNESAI